MTIHLVSTAAELMTAYQGAEDGDTIQLAAGDYGAVTLSGKTFSSGLTITSADPDNRAVLTDELLLQHTSNVTVTGIDVTPAQLGDSARDNWVTLRNCEDVTVSDMVITGYVPGDAEGLDSEDPNATRLVAISGEPYACGMYITNSTGTVVQGVEIADVRVALTIGDSTDTLVNEIFVHDDREGINLFDVTELTIQNSEFYNLDPWLPSSGNGDHGDFIQYWGVGTDRGIHKLTIDNNSFIQPPGADGIQTIFGYLDGTTASTPASNFVITDNVIVGTHVHAIVMEDVKHGEISGNVIVPNDLSVDDPEQIDTPAINVFNSRHIDVYDNTVLPFTESSLLRMDTISQNNGTIEIYDNTELSTDPNSEMFWQNWAEAILAGEPLPGDGEGDAPPDEDIPDDNIPVDTDGLNSNDLLRLQAEGADLRIGTNEVDVMHYGSTDSFLFAMESNDTLREGAGSDILSGGDGRDRFVVNLGLGEGETRDLIVDLDFSIGEVLTVISAPGSFTNDADPNNDLRLMSGGKIAWVDSVDDLLELIAAGEMTASEAADGDGLALVFADATDKVIEIASLTMDDLILA